MRDNLIASCSDDGIYLNRSARSRVVHNTILDTAGVEARFPETNGVAQFNLVDGPLRQRDGGSLDDVDNRLALPVLSFLGLHPIRRLFSDAAALDLHWADDAPRAGAAADADLDLCGSKRPARPAYGAFEDIGPCLKRDGG
jgi:parallel beta-helix repeat protein